MFKRSIQNFIVRAGVIAQVGYLFHLTLEGNKYNDEEARCVDERANNEPGKWESFVVEVVAGAMAS